MLDRDWQTEIGLLRQREQKARRILAFPELAGSNQIKHAWRRQSLKHHPDHNGGSPESQRRFILIQCAYRCLTEGLDCERLDGEQLPNDGPTDAKYRLDNPWGYFSWWRETFFG